MALPRTGAGRALQPSIDTLDFLVIAAQWRRGAVPGPAAGLTAGTALVATVLGCASAAAEAAPLASRAVA
jgi:hypothetical protein